MSIGTKLTTMIAPLAEFAVPLVCFLIACFLPGYAAYAFTDPFGIWLVGAMFLWSCIGLVLNFVCPQIFVRIIVGVVFSLPLSIFVYFVPTTVNALHGLSK